MGGEGPGLQPRLWITTIANLARAPEPSKLRLRASSGRFDRFAKAAAKAGLSDATSAAVTMICCAQYIKLDPQYSDSWIADIRSELKAAHEWDTDEIVRFQARYRMVCWARLIQAELDVLRDCAWAAVAQCRICHRRAPLGVDLCKNCGDAQEGGEL